MSGLYIHVPYCASKCAYCDFYSVAKAKPQATVWAAAYVDALLHELDERATFLPAAEPLRTIYLGGGTPSLLPPAQIQRLLQSIADRLDTTHVTEVTLEANPEDVDADFAQALAATTVNRVSMGVQSFVDEELRAINRRHDSHRAATAVAALRAAGFHNLSLDLMYGLPGQTLDSFQQSVDRCLQLNVEHISAYCLSVEPDTLLARRVERRQVTLPDEDLCLDLSQMLRTRLQQAGYEQYEISNYARPGFRSEHNSSYWVATPYLGLGPGAHSYDGAFRRGYNAPDLPSYLRGQRQYEEETLTMRDRYHETVMLGLRTRQGIAADTLQRYLEADEALQAHFSRQYAAIEAEGLIHTLPTGNIALTARGLNLADDVIRRFFLT